MLSISQVPPKEGRQVPSRVFAGTPFRARRQRKRFLLISSSLVLVALVFIALLKRQLFLGPSGPIPGLTKSESRREHSAQSSWDSQEAATKDIDGDETPSIKHSSDSQHVLLEDEFDTKQRPDFDDALNHVIDLMPDELEVQYILQQLSSLSLEPDAHGLKSLGLLVRKYNKLFTAWEDLHLAGDDDNGLHVHDDVIQYLRYTATSSPDDERFIGDAELRRKIQSYEMYRQFLTKLGQSLFPWTSPYHGDLLSFHSSMAKGGRGIVLTAGNSQAPFLLTSIPTLRYLGCNLPIEIMYAGDSDLKEDVRNKLESLGGVITRDISLMIHPEGWTLGGWAVKPFAILFSSFQEILFIDADSFFFQNPEILFDTEDYTLSGALFFRDRLIFPESKQEWLKKLLPKPISDQVMKSRPWVGTSGQMQESGVLVVDKWQHFIPLLLAAHLNGPLSKGVYKMVYGDKETFWLGWELAGDLNYAFYQGAAGTLGVAQEVPPQPTGPHANETHFEICSPQLLHLDIDGKPLWFNGWLAENKFDKSKQDKIATFRHYMREPDNPHQWRMQQSNMCCLWGLEEQVQSFTPTENQVLGIMIEEAKKAIAATSA